jgi:hypothetical protein
MNENDYAIPGDENANAPVLPSRSITRPPIVALFRKKLWIDHGRLLNRPAIPSDKTFGERLWEE